MAPKFAPTAPVNTILWDPNNYLDWSLRVKTRLMDQQLWDIVEGTNEPPKAENDEFAFKAWSEKNAMALRVIRHSCGWPFNSAIGKITSAKISWDTLAAICALYKTSFIDLNMVSMSTSTAAGFKRLEDIENYMDWSIQVKTKLTDRQLWDIVEGTEEILEAETDEAASQAWFEKNAMALGVIRYSCGGRLCWVIEMITSAKIAWHTLAAICKLPISSYKDVFKNLEDVDNYLDWSLQVKTKLADQQLWDIVEGNDEAPKAESDEAAFKAWSEKNAMALGVIRYSGEGPLKWAIWKITSAKIAWDTLAAICTLHKSSFIVTEEYDYVAWRVRMKAYLKACDLWDIVEAATQPPKPEDDEIAFNAWSKKDAIALYLIRESSSAFYSSLFPAGTAQNAWDILAKFYNSEGRENSELRKYVLFKQYLRDGNWAAANQFITSNPGAESAIISNTRTTALHIAIIAGHLHIVKELVKMLPTDKLRMTDKDGNTVLGCCALVGNTEMAKCIVEKCPMLLSIGNGNKFERLIPVVMALTRNSNSIATAQYLYSVTPPGSLSPGKGSVNGATFVTRCIYSKNFDMALDVLEKFPTLVTALGIEDESPVLALASMSFPYTSENQLISWKQRIYNCIRFPGVDDINQIPVSIQKPEKGKSTQVRNIGLGIRQTSDYESKHQYKKLLLRMCQELQCSSDKQLEKGLVYEAIFKATKKGMIEFVTAIWSACPELVSAEEEFTGRNPFMCAVLYRQYEIFRLLYCFSLKDSILAATDDEGNNILHMAAMTDPSARRNTIPGAAFHMQRDLQWFKEVKSIVSPSLIEAENDDGFTPQDLFVENHKGLVDQAKNWIKETTSSCTVPAILIVIIMFAAAITVRGGNNQNTSLPMFSKDKVFMLFMLSNALFLASATTSLLVFHTITSRNLEEDFLISLPQKMIIGLSSLIFSIAPMMVNFLTSLSIILDGNLWVVIPIICLVTVPVILFAWKQVHLLLAMVASTYRPRIFDRNVKPWM